MDYFFKKKKKKENEYQLILANQSQRIDELKSELVSLNEELVRLKEREERVADVLVFAKERAKEYLDEIKVRYMLEYERLKGYSERWKGKIANLESAKSLGQEVVDTERELRLCAIDIKKSMSLDLPFKTPEEMDFDSELQRINEISENNAVDEQMDDDELKKLIVQLIEKADNN